MRTKRQPHQTTEYGISAVLALCLAGLTFFLCYRQALCASLGLEEYHSDILAYMQTVRGEESGYSFPYPVMFTAARLLSLIMPVEAAMAAVIALAQTASFLLLRHYLGACMNRYGTKSGWSRLAAPAGALALLFVSMLFVPNHELPGIRFYYVGVFSPNPFHNATYAAARPFSILTVFSFTGLLETYEKRLPVREAVLFSVWLLLATMTKPSFTIVFLGAAGLILLFRLLKNRFGTFRQTMLFGLTFLPVFIDLLYQYSGVFTGTDSKGQEAGIGFGLFYVWREYCQNYALAIVLAGCFPLIVLIFHFRRLFTDTLYRFGWQLYGMSLAMFILLYEKGFRRVDANFSWGYMIGIFFVMTVSLIVLLKDTFDPGQRDRGEAFALCVQWGAFGLHLVCGILYFYNILTGGSYY